MEEKRKFPLSVEVIVQQQKRNSYSPEHGTGNPNLDPGELQNSKAWKEHAPAKQVKPKKSA